MLKNNKLVIRNNSNNRIYLINKSDFFKYFDFQGEILESFETATGNIISVDTRYIHEIQSFTPVINPFIKIKYATSVNYKKEDNPNFSIVDGIIEAKLPCFTVWFDIKTNKSTHEGILDKIWMEINKTLYKFPYGNVLDNGEICIGNTRLPTILNAESLYYFIISSNFNRDRSQFIKGSNNYPTTFNLDLIKDKIKKNEICHISVVDMIYYLSTFTNNSEIDPNLFFFKMPENHAKWFYERRGYGG